jgi:hypothetical protein
MVVTVGTSNGQRYKPGDGPQRARLTGYLVNPRSTCGSPRRVPPSERVLLPPFFVHPLRFSVSKWVIAFARLGSLTVFWLPCGLLFPSPFLIERALQEVRSAVAAVLAEASRCGALTAAGLRLLPDPPPVHLHPAHVHSQPEQLLLASLASTGGGGDGDALATMASLTLGATLAGAGGSSNSLATQILASPAIAAVAPGAAATAAHMLPPSHSLRAVEDWTMYDTAVRLPA